MQSRNNSISTISEDADGDNVSVSSNSVVLSSSRKSSLPINDGHRESLGEALKESRDFYFDMSDRWKYALLTTLDEPIRPEPPAPAPRGRGLERMASFMKRSSLGFRRENLE